MRVRLLKDKPLELAQSRNKHSLSPMHSLRAFTAEFDLDPALQATEKRAIASRRAFIQRFPVSELHTLTVDDYVIGRTRLPDGNEESFPLVEDEGRDVVRAPLIT